MMIKIHCYEMHGYMAKLKYHQIEIHVSEFTRVFYKNRFVFLSNLSGNPIVYLSRIKLCRVFLYILLVR